MPDTINHDQQVQPCLVPPVKDADVADSSVPLPPGLRDIRLSEQAAAEIKKVVDDPAHPTHTGREMPTADPSALLGKDR
jgi:hypothetical protein